MLEILILSIGASIVIPVYVFLTWLAVKSLKLTAGFIGSYLWLPIKKLKIWPLLFNFIAYKNRQLERHLLKAAASFRGIKVLLYLMAMLLAAVSTLRIASYPRDMITLYVFMVICAFSAGTASIYFFSKLVDLAGWSQRPASKVLIWGIIVGAFAISRPVGSAIVAEATGVVSVNLPWTASMAALTLVCLAWVNALLVSNTLVQVAVYLYMSNAKTRREKRKQSPIHSLAISRTLFGTAILINIFLVMLANRFTGGFVHDGFWNVFINKTVFDFDAAPPDRCLLNDGEMEEIRISRSNAKEPEFKVIHLAASQEKALLIKAKPKLLQPLRIRDIDKDNWKDRTFEIQRAVKCYQTDVEISELSRK